MKTLLFICCLLVSSVVAEAQSTRFPGFSRGQSGAGALFGNPFSARYQRWIDWRSATFFSFGYGIDEFMMADANYSYYFLSEDDRWKLNHKVGLIMYNAFAGLTGGTYIGKSKNEKGRLGARVGGAFEYLMPDSPWSVRLEVAPVLYLSGSTTAGIQGGIAVMYYFGSSHKKSSSSEPESGERRVRKVKARSKSPKPSSAPQTAPSEDLDL